MSKKVVGILGGMGPKATVDFMDKVITKTPVDKDQDHLRMLVDNNPQVPDRTKSILSNEESPGPILQKMAMNLQNMGADILVMPCNTAHYYYEQVCAQINIPFINMLHCTAEYISEFEQDNKGDHKTKVGLLATNGTLESKIYQTELAKYNLQLVDPGVYQNRVMEAIYSVKRGDLGRGVTNLLTEPINYLIKHDVKAIIMGCTEIPVLLTDTTINNVNLVDPTDVLADRTISYALNSDKNSMCRS